MFAVKTSVLKKLLADAEWSAKLERAQTTEEMQRVIERYCHQHKLKVKHL
jgi:hypothetical protein